MPRKLEPKQTKQQKALQMLRHSCSHILAQVVLELWPKTRLGIGPAIEDGFYYDFDDITLKPEDLEKIEKKMNEIVKKNLKFKRLSLTKEKAKSVLKGQKYKLELLKELPGKKISLYEHGGFIDLCKGPHIRSTSEIKAFKLLNIAGAYWKGDSKNKMLQRIYGTAFLTGDELNNFLKIREEAEKRDHKKIGKQLDLFSFHEEAPGFVFWHPKGMAIIDELLNFWKQEHKKRGYLEVKTPIILSKALWEQSGHWDHYKENMYFLKIDQRDFAVKPMNCPGGILIYKEKIHSYRELPLKVAELGLVHRHELSGVLSGLFRVRAFTQDDAHIYLEEDQIADEVSKVIELADYTYNLFGFEYSIELSTRPKKSLGSKKIWDKAEAALKKALELKKSLYRLNKGDGAFYGPKIDFHLKDSIGRTWQCGTIQLDFAMPEKFWLTYEGKDGKKHVPVMLHRTVLGSIERFIGVLIEHYAGKFPLWLAPVQTKIVTLADRNIKFANELKEKLSNQGLRIELDERPETMARKIRDAETEKIPIILTIGDKEESSNTLAVRRGNKVEFNVKIEAFIESVLREIKAMKGL